MITVQAVDCVVLPNGRTAQRGERFAVSREFLLEEKLRRFPRFVDVADLAPESPDEFPDLIDATADAMLVQMASQSTRRETEQVLGGARAAASKTLNEDEQSLAWLQVERETW